MPRRSKGPWKRSSGGWWCWHQGKLRRLGDTKTDAWRAWHLLQAGEPIHTGAKLFRDIADDYVLSLERTRSARHAKDARYRLDQFVQPWWHRPAEGLRWPDVESVLQTKAWNPTTQAGHLIALRGCLRWAVKTRLLDANPIPHISIPRAVSKQDALTAKQIQTLLKHAPLPLYPILWALSVTGARPGELMKATVDQCDADGTAIRLRESKVGKRIVWFPKKERKALAAHRKLIGSGPLFPAVKGAAWTQSRLNQVFRKARESAGLESWVTPYTLRHSWITEQLRKMSTDDVARLAGTSVKMIEATYGHLADADVKRLADRL